MDRAKKSELVATLNSVFSKNAGSFVVAHNLGLTVAQITDLRLQMAQEGATLKVAKNRLVKLAIDGTDAEGVKELFVGPTTIAYSDDPVAAPKVAAKFAKKNDKYVVLGGAMGATVLDNAGIKALAELPSLDELRAMLVGMIQTPATRIASILQAPGGQVARVLNAYATKEEAA